MNINYTNKKVRLTSYVKQIYNYITRLGQNIKKASPYRVKEESKMYELEIETRYKIFRVENPKMAKVSEHFLYCSVKVKDEKGFWHTVGHCKYPKDAEELVKKLNNAILRGEDTVYLDI